MNGTLDPSSGPVPSDMGQLIFERLNGRWRQSRTIVPGGTYTGEAVFAPITPTSLRYTEEGMLVLDGGVPVISRRSYIYQIETGRIRVMFDEDPPRLFHDLDFHSSEGCSKIVSEEAVHICGSDTYRSTYEIISDKEFIIRHRVFGARKNYVMTTIYTAI